MKIHKPPAAAAVLLGILASMGFSRADVTTNVPEASDYEVVYELLIPVNGAFQGVVPVPYLVDNSATAAPAGFDRVAYYLELTNGSGTTWAYASMDAFTAQATETGLPHAVTNPNSFQQSVSNLHVLSNVPSVQTGYFDRGEIELWHHTYTQGNAKGVYAASATTNDWGDTIGAVASGYGSFQIHNPIAKQTVLAYNRWASATATNDDVGIGNFAGTNPDWTTAANTATYTVRKLVVLVRPKRFDVALSAFPKIQQVTPRDVSTNLAAVPVFGTESMGGHDRAVLKILRNGVPHGPELERDLTYSGGAASFSFNPEIPAELASYTFELYLKQGPDLRLVRSVHDVTAGDVYLWYGQSNGESKKFNGSSATYLSPWVRTFGMNSDFANFTQQSTFWVEADGDAHMEFPAGIGQWPLVVGRKIVDTYHIPVAILNGSRAGYDITRLQRDDAAPDNLSDTGTTTYRVYNRLRHRAIQAGIANKVRAIFFYQGESDANDAAQHLAGYNALMEDWETDYPNIERVFVSQVHVGCGQNLVARELPELRNVQRLFADVYEHVEIMSTNGLTTHTDNCHFPFAGGYETHGHNTFKQVQRELYGLPDSPAIDPPNPASVEFSASDRIRIVLRKAAAGITVDPESLVDFRLNGSSANLIAAHVTGDAIELEYDGTVATATSLDYLAHIGSAGGWIRNSNGVGLLAFSEPVTGEPVIDDNLEITLISPAGVAELTPGSEFQLNAGATSPVTSITRMEIIIDGILHTAVNSSATISAGWTVPASGAHAILFRATNAAGNSSEKSVVIFAGATSSPGGVSSGLSVWLKPETGIVRDANGSVSSWQDSSGNNNHCVQATAAARPTYQENRFGPMPGVHFDGGDWLTGSAGMSTGSYTKIVRVRMPDFDSPSGNILSSSAASGTRHALFMAATSKARLWHNSGSGFVISNTDMTANTGHLLVGTYDGATKTGTLYLDGAQVGSGSAAANTTDPTYQLGNLGGGAFTMRGDIGEVIIYNRVINGTERATIETYLNQKASPPPAAPLTGYSTWSSEAIARGDDDAPTGDANLNGVPNLIEFALGFESTGPRPPLSVSVAGSHIHLSYSRPTDRTGIIYQLLESTDLSAWSAVDEMAGPAAAGFEQRDAIRPIVQPGGHFYKLQVESAP